MTRKEIQSLLKERGISQATLARSANVKPATMSQFLRRKFKSQKLSFIVNRAIGVDGAI